jgi:hypothetical protein
MSEWKIPEGRSPGERAFFADASVQLTMDWQHLIEAMPKLVATPAIASLTRLAFEAGFVTGGAFVLECVGNESAVPRALTWLRSFVGRHGLLSDRGVQLAELVEEFVDLVDACRARGELDEERRG